MTRRKSGIKRKIFVWRGYIERTHANISNYLPGSCIEFEQERRHVQKALASQNPWSTEVA